MNTKKNPTAEERQPPQLRFVATLRALVYAKAVALIADLALDRLPDTNGQLRLLVSPQDLERLLAQGVEVTLLAALPIAPLNPSLILTTPQSKRWLDAQVKRVPKKGAK